MLTHQPLYSRLHLFRTFSIGLVLSLLLLLCGLFSFLPQALPIAHADETAPDLPTWAIGPFTRSSNNPLLTFEGNGFEAKDVYNPGVVIRNGTYYMLYRALDSQSRTSIGEAQSTDGIHFTRNPTPVITGSQADNDAHGVEDPRLFESNGTYYTYYTADPASGGTNLAVATSTDLLHWQKQGVAISGTKNGAVVVDPQDHPVKINNQYLMYYGDNSGGVAYSSDLIHWTKGPGVNLPTSYRHWEFCVAVINYQAVQGGPVNPNILVFEAGKLMSGTRGDKGWYYGISEAEYSSTNPAQQLGQLDDAALSPGPSYEQTGLTSDTVFMNSISFYNGQWLMYYGAADHVIALATAPLRSPNPARFLTGLESGDPQPTWTNAVDTSSGGISHVNGYCCDLTGPELGVRQETARDGSSALMYSGYSEGGTTDYAYMKVFDLSGQNITVSPGMTLNYWIYPQAMTSGSLYVTGTNSTCVAIDLVFTDGTALRNLGASDQDGNRLHPAYQCNHLTTGVWNQVISAIGAVANGKTIARLDIGYDQPGGSGGYRGYIDDINISID